MSVEETACYFSKMIKKDFAFEQNIAEKYTRY